LISAGPESIWRNPKYLTVHKADNTTAAPYHSDSYCKKCHHQIAKIEEYNEFARVSSVHAAYLLSYTLMNKTKY
jgi:hypothetical protein